MFTGTRGEDDMGSTTTVDGLVSGMNTSQVISQLMQLAAQPQTNLKNAVTKENAVISAYQSVNSRLAALQTAAEAFTPPSALTPVNPTWQSAKATSSATAADAQITVGNPAAGGYTLNSATNTFGNAVPHVTLTVSQLANGVSVTTSSDVDAIADKMKSMIDAANGALSQIGAQSAYNAT